MSVAAHAFEEQPSAHVRVVVALAHARLCGAIEVVLRSTGEVTVVARAHDTETAIRCTRAARPDVLLLGSSLLAGDVLQNVQAVVVVLGGVPLVIAGHEDRAAYVAAVMAAGAAAYVPLHGDAGGFAGVLQWAARSAPVRLPH
jgi:DNA-binding NarL/FixJ family response regulator